MLFRSHAQFVWFSDHSWRRIAWSPVLLGYFRRNFRLIMTDRFGDALYERRDGAGNPMRPSSPKALSAGQVRTAFPDPVDARWSPGVPSAR